MKDIILATENAGKIKEFQALLAPIECIAQNSLDIYSVPETGLSFIENALIKARHASKIAQKPALADDSGLVVPALDGAPGIYSARYAGDDANALNNMHLLLKKMAHLPAHRRQAYFYCAIAIVRHAEDPTPLVATGSLNGTISLEPQGHEGFGYDPVFYLHEYQCTVAQLPATIKNTISHRAKALLQLRALMSQYND